MFPSFFKSRLLLRFWHCLYPSQEEHGANDQTVVIWVAIEEGRQSSNRAASLTAFLGSEYIWLHCNDSIYLHRPYSAKWNWSSQLILGNVSPKSPRPSFAIAVPILLSQCFSDFSAKGKKNDAFASTCKNLLNFCPVNTEACPQLQMRAQSNWTWWTWLLTMLLEWWMWVTYQPEGVRST